MELSDEIRRVLEAAVADGVQSACQCCVFKDGECVAEVAAGSYERGGVRKIDAHSLFPICSTGKAFLATTAMRLCDRGLFALDDPISRYWPELRGEGKEEITFREVFGHRAGLVPEFPELPREAMSDWAAMARRCAEAAPIFPHGTQSAYLALTLTWYLGHPMTLITGKPLPEIIRDEVLSPCGIEGEAIFGGCGEVSDRVVTVYDVQHDHLQRLPRHSVVSAAPPPPKCLHSVVSAAPPPPKRLTFSQMNHDCRVPACVPAGHTVASARAIATLFAKLPQLLSPRILAEARRPNGPPGRENETTYGLGLRLWGPDDDRGQILGHSGFGGSEGWYDCKSAIAFGYTCACEATARRPPYDLRRKLYEIIGVTPNLQH